MLCQYLCMCATDARHACKAASQPYCTSFLHSTFRFTCTKLYCNFDQTDSCVCVCMHSQSFAIKNYFISISLMFYVKSDENIFALHNAHNYLLVHAECKAKTFKCINNSEDLQRCVCKCIADENTDTQRCTCRRSVVAVVASLPKYWLIDN